MAEFNFGYSWLQLFATKMQLLKLEVLLDISILTRNHMLRWEVVHQAIKESRHSECAY